jgi:ABC-type lipoprotein release transport system permease subunit
LRCIGLENDKISRVFLWESIIVVLNGGVVGLCTGITVAGVILIQNSLWVELRPKFNFPWPLL